MLERMWTKRTIFIGIIAQYNADLQTEEKPDRELALPRRVCTRGATMVRRRFTRVALLLVTLSLLPSVWLPSPSVQAQTATIYTSPQFGFRVSWKSPWHKTEEVSIPGEYDRLQLQLDAYDFYHEFYGLPWNEVNSAEILHRFVKQHRSNIADLTISQEWSPEGAQGQPMVIEYDAGGQRLTEYLHAIPLEGNRGVYINVVRRPVSGIGLDPFTLRDLDRLVQVDLGNSAGGGDLGDLQPVLPVCERVELYPGYPGYRGYVTGVAGPGETACLADLTVIDPTFSKEREDRLNRETARRLGILRAGAERFEEWTWEAWMAIEAGRGLIPHCHSCLWVNGSPLPPELTSPNPDDPRLQLGRFGQRTIMERYLREQGQPLWRIEQSWTDEEVRAIVGLLMPGHYPTATEILTYAGRIWDGRGGVSPAQLATALVNQGGYVPVPPSATPGDQIYLMTMGAYVMKYFMGTKEWEYIIWRPIEREVRLWRIEIDTKRYPLSLGEWIRQSEVLSGLIKKDRSSSSESGPGSASSSDHTTLQAMWPSPPDELVALLAEEPVPAESLPPVLSHVTPVSASGGDTVPASVTGFVRVDFATSRRTMHSLTYHVFPSVHAAERYYQLNVLKRRNDGSRIVSEMPMRGYPAVLLASRDGTVATCWVWTGDVVILAVSNAGEGMSPDFALATTWGLGVAGLGHLQRISPASPSVERSHQTGTPPLGDLRNFAESLSHHQPGT